MAFLEGKSLRYLFTGRLRIKSRFWLSIAGFVSIVLIAPVVLYLIPLLTPRPSTTILVPAEGYVTMRDIYLEPLSFTTIYLSLFAVVGVALLLNVILSIAKNNRKQ